MLSRKDIRPKQTQMLLSAGFLPVSVDYRLCPETTLVEGPTTDVTDALKWARETLPHIALKRNDICITGEYVVAVGWSTGGTLAMSLGCMAPARGLRPPEAVLAFYCPTDYEDECWIRENKPFGETTLDADAYDVYEGVADSPIVAYNPPTATRTAGGWMSKSDPRSRIVLHMNWHAQTLPILLHGLKDKKKRAARSGTELLPQPSLAEVQTISPLAHIRNGSYKTPTFLVHPTEDDLIPYEQSERTISELRSRGVTAEIRVVKDAGHLFDMHPRYERNQEAKAAVEDGYAFLARFVEEG
jgi:acetyl esterase/lipase